MVVEICPAVKLMCQNFAVERIKGSQSLYAARGEANKQKMLEDTMVGAMAEHAVYQLLTERGLEVTKPDLTIYETSRKSYAPDITSVDHHFHVKSQTKKSADRYGESFLFQKSDRLFNIPSEKEKLVFCIVDDNKVNIRAIVSAIDIVEANLLKEPKVWRYQLTKRALYLSDVLANIKNTWNLT